jgi:hypothetical protein
MSHKCGAKIWENGLRKRQEILGDDTLLDRCYVMRFIIDCRASDGGDPGLTKKKE